MGVYFSRVTSCHLCVDSARFQAFMSLQTRGAGVAACVVASEVRGTSCELWLRPEGDYLEGKQSSVGDAVYLRQPRLVGLVRCCEQSS